MSDADYTEPNALAPGAAKLKWQWARRYFEIPAVMLALLAGALLANAIWVARVLLLERF